VNSPVHLPTKTERLELALRSGTLADVAGMLAEMSPGDVAYLISSSPPDYRDLLLGLLEPDQEVLVVTVLLLFAIVYSNKYMKANFLR